MIAREYTKRISVFETTNVADGYGGNTVSEVFIFSSWAKLETNGVGYKAKDLGLVNFNDPLLFKVRHRNDFDYNGRKMYVLYNNNKYIIQGVRNVNELNIDLEIFCSKMT